MQITQVTGQLAQLQKDDAINRDRLDDILEDLQINGIANEETASSYAELKRSMEKLRRDEATEHQKFEELVSLIFNFWHHEAWCYQFSE